MKTLIKNEFRRAFCNKKHLFIMLVESLIVLIYTVDKVYPICSKTIPFLMTMIDSGKGIYMPGAYFAWLGFGHNAYNVIIFAILPILAAIPYGSSLYVDEKTKYIYQIQLRVSKKKYYRIKLLMMFLSGGWVAAYPFFLSLIINATILPFEYVTPASHEFMTGIYVLTNLFYQCPLLYIFIYILEIFFVFGILNCLCFVAAYLFVNRFVVLVTPFTVYFAGFVMGSFASRNITPWVYVRMKDMRKDDIGIMALQIGILFCVLLGTCMYKSSRKVDTL